MPTDEPPQATTAVCPNGKDPATGPFIAGTCRKRPVCPPFGETAFCLLVAAISLGGFCAVVVQIARELGKLTVH